MNRPAYLAGEFYPGEKKELGKTVDWLLAKAELPKIEGEIFGLLLPHADYGFSGPVAACGFKAVAGRNFDTVVIIGDSHYERFDGVAVWPGGAWETPLGKVKVDNILARAVLDSSDRFFSRDSAHLFEHSIEMQLPFLQKILKRFKILPIIFGSEDKDWKKLAKVMLENIQGKRVLIIASADLSHYLPYQQAKKVDQRTLDNIVNLQTNNLEVCAPDSVKTLIEIAKNMGGRSELLKYTSSGKKGRVVGYGTVAFYPVRKREIRGQ